MNRYEMKIIIKIRISSYSIIDRFKELSRADERYFTDVSQHNRSPFDACKVCMQLWARMPRSALSNFLAKVVRGAPFSVQPARSSGIGRTRLPGASSLFAERIKTRKGGGIPFFIERSSAKNVEYRREFPLDHSPLFTLSVSLPQNASIYTYDLCGFILHEWRCTNWKLEGSSRGKGIWTGAGYRLPFLHGESSWKWNWKLRRVKWNLEIDIFPFLSIGNLVVCRFYYFICGGDKLEETGETNLVAFARIPCRGGVSALIRHLFI